MSLNPPPARTRRPVALALALAALPAALLAQSLPPAPAPGATPGAAAPWPQPPGGRTTPAPAPWPQPVAPAPWPQPVAPAAGPAPRPAADAPWPVPVPASGAPLPGGYAQRADALRWAEDLQRRTGLPAAMVQAALREAEFQPRVTLLIIPGGGPTTAKDWGRYRARFVEPRRIGAGRRFWDEHAAVLARAEAEFGVPAAVVVGILGVETLYGEQTGQHRVLDALATLAFDFPPLRRDRSAFFRDELGEFLVWCHREGLAPGSVLGSFAGAIGLPQFMPSSINRHARDYDGDGRIDLRSSPVDAIGSVAQYLQRHGWQRGLPAFFPVEPPADAEALATLLAPDILPSFSAAEFQARGARLPPEGQAHAGKLALVSVDNGDGGTPTRVAGTENFYALTRYNWSSYYALAVLALGDAVAAARGVEGALPWAVPGGPRAGLAPPAPALARAAAGPKAKPGRDRAATPSAKTAKAAKAAKAAAVAKSAKPAKARAVAKAAPAVKPTQTAASAKPGPAALAAAPAAARPGGTGPARPTGASASAR